MTTKIGIKSVAGYLPPKRHSNLDLLETFNVDENFVRNKIGVLQRTEMAADEQASDLCAKAFKVLAERTGFDPATTDCLCVCTQNPDGHGLPHTSAIVQHKIGASESCAAFDIGLGCSGYVYSLSVMLAFMAANNMQNGLLFTADPYSRIVAENDRNTRMLFGDGATVTLLGPDPTYMAKRFVFGTAGKHAAELINNNNRLHMNGRAIFNFSMLRVPTQVRCLLNAAELETTDVDHFIFHQASRYIIDNLRKRLHLPTEKVPIRLEEHGNTISSSIPLVLESIMEQSPGEIIVISGFGVGLSWASGLLQKNKESS